MEGDAGMALGGPEQAGWETVVSIGGSIKPRRSPRKRLSVFLFSLVLTVGLAVPPVVGSAQAAPVFGFNYWPYNGDNSILGANWPTSSKPEVASDLDHIASLGGGVIRLLIWPGTGDNCDYPSLPDRPWCLTEDGGGTLTSEFRNETAHISDLIKLAYDRNIKVIIAFGNYYLTCGPDTDAAHVTGCPPAPGGRYWWQWAYDNYPSNSCAFLRDASTWINRYVNAIEGSTYSSAVIAYYYQNAVSAYYDYGTGGSCSLRNNWDYIKYVYDHTTVPPGKRGVAVFCVICPNRPSDAQALRDHLDTAKRPLDFLDFHSYPDHSTNSNLEAAYDQVKSYFPTATVVLGEFGHETPSTADEAQQASTVTTIMQRAQAKGIPYYLHWSLWDKVHGASDETFGFGYTPDDPKSVLGSVSSLMHGGSSPAQLVSNPDMETVANGKPANWAVGKKAVPAGSLTLSAMGPDSADAATNNYYARATVDSSVTSGSFWLTTGLLAVTPSKRLTVNGYVRNNLSNSVQLWVNEYRYDSVNNSYEIVRRTPAPELPPPDGWVWRNYLHTVGSWSLVLSPDTSRVSISFVAQAGCWNPVSCPSLLDVDAVSAAQS